MVKYLLFITPIIFSISLPFHNLAHFFYKILSQGLLLYLLHKPQYAPYLVSLCLRPRIILGQFALGQLIARRIRSLVDLLDRRLVFSFVGCWKSYLGRFVFLSFEFINFGFSQVIHLLNCFMSFRRNRNLEFDFRLLLQGLVGMMDFIRHFLNQINLFGLVFVVVLVKMCSFIELMSSLRLALSFYLKSFYELYLSFVLFVKGLILSTCLILALV